MSATILQQLVAELDAVRLRIVDLTQPLGPDTPVIGLPPIFAPSPGVTIDVISKYDDKGPAWYWNTIHMGEHTGTHFDAPVHWITGKDLPNNACDTIEPRRFVGPACVIDITREVAANADYLLTPQDLERWEKQHGRVPKMPGCCCAPVGASERPPRNSSTSATTDHAPGFHQDTSRILAHDRDVLGVGVETIGTDAGQAGRFDPPFPNHDDAWGWQVRSGQPL
jgi:kynurenine formamidase